MRALRGEMCFIRGYGENRQIGKLLSCDYNGLRLVSDIPRIGVSYGESTGVYGELRKKAVLCNNVASMRAVAKHSVFGCLAVARNGLQTNEIMKTA